jgi:hypothetical protein
MSSTFTLESFAIISNADTSILHLNEIIQPDGYEFLYISPEQLEGEFYEVFNYPKEQVSSKAVVVVQDKNVLASEFYNIVQDTHLLSLTQIIDNSIVFLKRTKSFEYDLEKGSKFIDDKEDVSFNYYVNDLIQKLRLYKPQSIKSTAQFHKFKENNRVIRKLRPPVSVQDFNPKYSIQQEEIEDFKKVYDMTFDNSLVKLALANFNLSYLLNERKIMFINLIVCLESLFNQGKDQISHTISRHLAIILSTNLEEFKANYSRVKKLYSMRSDIVHGNKDINPHDEAVELREYVRRAIIFCAEFGGNKKELFEYLNTKGY